MVRFESFDEIGTSTFNPAKAIQHLLAFFKEKVCAERVQLCNQNGTPIITSEVDHEIADCDGSGLRTLSLGPQYCLKFWIGQTTPDSESWMTNNAANFKHLLLPLMERNQENQENRQSCPARLTELDMATEIAEKITSLFEFQLIKHRPKNGVEDQWNSNGRQNFKSKVIEFVELWKPVHFVLPAFPFKSRNKEKKVLGDLPDMGEFLGLRRLQAFLESIGAFYEPGAFLVIFNDDTVYSDIIYVTDEVCSRYRSTVRSMNSSPVLKWSDMDEFFPWLTNTKSRLRALENLFGPTQEEFNQRLRSDPDFLQNYIGFRNVAKDELLIPAELSCNRRRKAASEYAQRLLYRNSSYSVLIRCIFASHIRLTIHPSSNTHKFSVNLVGSTDWGTPWHNCALRLFDGSWTLIRKEQAGLNRCQLRLSPEGLPFYEQTQPLL